MHELAITQSILNIAENAAKEHGVKKVREVRIKIGDYSGVVPQCVRYYFDVISKGTVAEGAELKMERLPILMRCEACNWQVLSGHGLYHLCSQDTGVLSSLRLSSFQALV